MRIHTLSLLIFVSLFSNLTQANEVFVEGLPTIKVQAEDLDTNKQHIYHKDNDNKTLGDIVKGLSGVQSSHFGPHAGAPVIRSLSGNRINIKENGVNVNGLNAISAGTNIAFDPVFHRLVSVQKFNNVVKEGGHAIGGSVEIDSGLIAKTMADKSMELEVHLQKGFNDIDSHGIKANFNNQENISFNLLYSTQRLDNYDIVGQSKADVCQQNLISRNAYGLGYNTDLVNQCQRQPIIKSEFNIASKKYYIADYYDITTGKIKDAYSDWGLTLTDVFTNVKNPSTKDNPHYMAGTPEKVETVDKILDITENYHKKLGNSDLKNERLGFAASYFWQDAGQQNYIALSKDNKKSAYGLPGFSLSNLGAGLDYRSGQPVRIESIQDKLALEGETHHLFAWLNKMKFNLAHITEQSKERVGLNVANDYHFKTSQLNGLFYHQPHQNLSGTIGLFASKRKITGAGESVYLPDVNSDNYAIFIQETLSFKPVDITLGYRHEYVQHQPSQFKTARNAKNRQLQQRDFGLNSYEMQVHYQPWDNFAINARYAHSKRAPEVNELYASNLHYSIMAQEEGNQNLKPEQVQSKELTALWNIKNVNITASIYENAFKDYIHLASSGVVADAARMPLKYWQQNDVKITGFELDISRDFNLGEYGILTVSTFADWVKNKHLNTTEVVRHNDGIYMPNMPSNRYGLSLDWQYQTWNMGVDAIHYDQPRYQNAQSETALPAYTLVNADIKKEINWRDYPVTLRIGATNLLNEEARPHNSPLRYIAPLPARAFTMGITAKF